jgi:hypothetical protein
MWRSRPKVTTDKSAHTFVNDDTHEKIEIREIEFSWGPLPFCNRLLIGTIPKNSTYELTVAPISSITCELEPEFVKERSSIIDPTYRALVLINRSYFRRENIRSVLLETRTPVGTGYVEKIIVDLVPRDSPREILIRNDNLNEIQNYRFPVPSSITLDKLTSGSEVVEVSLDMSTRVLGELLDKRIRECTSDKLPITAVVRSLPPSKSGKSGEVIIPLT